ncbi:hypothetical protein FDP25_09745 [Roseovarius sp. A21]|uniref:Uncharacterized protein n=1 Tax=Roseovarius bejariae TaxID=2576383 RepID=A0A844CYK3_9RHOB|nr:hypothetical protein [Roseovarius bejariae]MRU15710.1 hypothetical protein [Roseovarius bejariae]
MKGLREIALIYELKKQGMSVFVIAGKVGYDGGHGLPMKGASTQSVTVRGRFEIPPSHFLSKNDF